MLYLNPTQEKGVIMSKYKVQLLIDDKTYSVSLSELHNLIELENESMIKKCSCCYCKNLNQEQANEERANFIKRKRGIKLIE